jgi:hypothetical protein
MLIMELKSKAFNLLTEFEKNKLVKDVTFKSLILLYEKIKKIEKIIEVENLLNKFETEIEIYYKTKETNLYKIEICYQINLKKTFIKIIAKYFDKRKETQNITTRDLYFMTTYFL